MMRDFRKLTNNFVFKIFLGFVALSFVTFGVSDFLLGGSSWIAKVDGKKISYNKFQRYLQQERNLIYQSPYGQNLQVGQYLNSTEFRNDVLGKMVNEILLEKLQQDFGVAISRETVLKIIAEDTNFKDETGRFSAEIFNRFLATNNISEDQYLNSVQNEVTLKTILQSLATTPIVNSQIATELNNYNKEKRSVDLYNISIRNIPEPSAPNSQDLEKFFTANQNHFIIPETRKIDYFTFSSDDLIAKITVSEDEVKSEYENNKQNFQKPETRNFHHVLFTEKEKADEFLASLKKNNITQAKAFLEEAKKITKKKDAELSLQNIAKSDLMPEISATAFALKENEISAIITSPIGYHILFLSKINPASQISFSDAKAGIKENLIRAKQEKALNEKKADIEDEILAANSLDKVAKEFNFKLEKVEFDKNGNDLKGKEIAKIKTLENFVTNSFSLGEKQSSQLHYSSANKLFYVLFVDKINYQRQQSLREVRDQAIALFKQEKRQEKLQDFANEIQENIKKNSNNSKILKALTKKHNLKVEENKKLSRFNYQQGQTAYPAVLLQEIFAIKAGETTSPQRVSKDNFVVAVVKKIEKYSTDKSEIANLLLESKEQAMQELLISYDQYLRAKYPIEINTKLLEVNDLEAQ